ncbi:MAG: Ig-like domain-containing protein, partial [Oscillospiraceae bacterium]|nr:Ig-like domain-containing protein [Oscillospiraceae bacterium]
MKKLLSLILAIALVLSLVPAVFAAEGEATEKTELRIKYDILGAVKKLGVSWESSVGVDGEKRVPFTNIDFALTDGFFSFKDSSCGIFTGHSELNYNNICGFQISSNDWIEFDIYVPKAGTYTMEMWCGTYTSDTRTKVYVNGTEVGEFSNYEENAPALTKVVDVPRYIEGITFEKAGIHTVRFFGTSDYCTAGTFYLVDSNAGASLSLATIVADIDKDILSCGTGETAIIETSLYMNDGSAVSDASAYPVSFKSDNEAVASVSEDGVVTPGAAGKAKITAYATNEFGEEVYAIKEISVVDGAVIKYDINKHLFTDLGYTDSTSVEEGSLTRLDETVTDGFYSYLGGMDYDRNYIKYSHGAGIIQLMSTGTKISFKVYVPIAGSYRVEADTLEVNTDRCDVDINVYITKDAANEYPKNLVGGYNAYNASATAAKSVRKSIGQYNFTEPGYYVINFVLAKGYQATSGSPYSFVGNFYLIGGANSTIMNGKITSSTSSINVDEGETAEVVATGFVSSTTEAATFTYSSSNTAVATVDSESGVVTPVAEGVAIITATSNADLANTLTTEIEVTCNKPGEAIADTKVNFMASAEEGGTVTDNKLVKEVAIGSNVTVEATANDGYEFAYWRNASGKHLSSNAKETFKVNT